MLHFFCIFHIIVLCLFPVLRIFGLADVATQSVFYSSGIVYAHRNEDIVNYGPGTQGTTEITIPQNGSLVDPGIHVSRKKKLDGIGGKENFPSPMDQKRIQYSRLSKFMGLGELEFSKWVISATPMERERVLVDFRKRKKKTLENIIFEV